MQATMMRYNHFHGTIRRELHLFALTCLPAQNVQCRLTWGSGNLSLKKVFLLMESRHLPKLVFVSLDSVGDKSNSDVPYKYTQLETGNNKCWVTVVTCIQTSIRVKLVSSPWLRVNRVLVWGSKTAIYKGKDPSLHGEIVANGKPKSHLGGRRGPDDLGSCE